MSLLQAMPFGSCYGVLRTTACAGSLFTMVWARMYVKVTESACSSSHLGAGRVSRCSYCNCADGM